jgi:hypothetical protein
VGTVAGVGIALAGARLAVALDCAPPPPEQDAMPAAAIAASAARTAFLAMSASFTRRQPADGSGTSYSSALWRGDWTPATHTSAVATVAPHSALSTNAGWE